MSERDSMLSILKNTNIFPCEKIKTSEEFPLLYENEELPQQVKLLIEVSRPESIESGRVIFYGEEIFWISSPFKLILFNPRNLSHIIECNIDYPIQTLFSYNLYLILSHRNSFVTLISFPVGFSLMFKNEDDEDFNYYSYTNKKSVLNLKPYEKIICPIPSSYFITCAQGNFIGCSDGVVRTFHVVGHHPDSKFFIKEAIINKSISHKSIPIASMKKAGNFLYCLDSRNFLTAYKIISENQLENIVEPIQFSKIVNISPFGESVIATCSKESIGNCSLFAFSVLRSHNWFVVKKKGFIVSNNITYENYKEICKNGHQHIYVLNTCITMNPPLEKSKKSDVQYSYIWPKSIQKVPRTREIIVYFDVYNNVTNFDLKYLQFQVNEGDIVLFSYESQKPLPFINVDEQFMTFSAHENTEMSFAKKEDQIISEAAQISSQKLNTADHKSNAIDRNGLEEEENEDDSRNEEEIDRIKVTEIRIKEIDDVNRDSKSDESYFLCVTRAYQLCPGQSIESALSVREINHSFWNQLGTLYCIIYSYHPKISKLFTFQFGLNSVVDSRNINGRIFSTTTNESVSNIMNYYHVKSSSCDPIIIFTSERLLKISMSAEMQKQQQMMFNSVTKFHPWLMKKCSMKNLVGFAQFLESEFRSIYPNFTDGVLNLVQNSQNIGKETDFPSQSRIRNMITDFESLQREILQYIQKQKLERRPNPTGAKLHMERRSSIERRTSSTVITEKINTIGALNSQYRSYVNNKDSANMRDWLEKTFELDSKNDEGQNKFLRMQCECMISWLSNDIMKLDEEEEFSETLIEARNALLKYRREHIIIE